MKSPSLKKKYHKVGWVIIIGITSSLSFLDPLAQNICFLNLVVFKFKLRQGVHLKNLNGHGHGSNIAWDQVQGEEFKPDRQTVVTA